jgi:phenylpyruvate tautomerase PptA (4-oxalocrotonate tautomerase family)
MAAGRTLDQKRKITEVLTKEFCRIAKRRPETITVMFNEGLEKTGVALESCSSTNTLTTLQILARAAHTR